MFDSVKSTKHQHKRNEFDNIEEVSIDKFMKDIEKRDAEKDENFKKNQVEDDSPQRQYNKRYREDWRNSTRFK